MAASPQFGRGLTGLLKKGWHEIPEVMGTTLIALVGMGMASIGVYRSLQEGAELKRYKFNYTVIRPDDPRVKDIPPPRKE